MSTLPPPITPAFAWAVPDAAPAAPAVVVEPKAKHSPKPVSNPLLKRASPRMSTSNGHEQQYSSTSSTNGFSGTSTTNGYVGAATRLPFSPMGNNQTSLRQRRKPASSSSTFLPPKSSLTEGSYMLDENLQTEYNTATEASKSPAAATVGGGDVVLWTGGATNAASSSADSWESWVLIYGFSSKAQYDEVLRRFDSFGRVVTQRGGRSNNNWVALHYESNLESEKALCQQTCVLSDGSVVGVSRMDQKMSQSLDWDATSTTPAAAAASTGSTTANKSKLDESDVLLQASYGSGKRGGSVCEKFLAFIFGWNDVMR